MSGPDKEQSACLVPGFKARAVCEKGHIMTFKAHRIWHYKTSCTVSVFFCQPWKLKYNFFFLTCLSVFHRKYMIGKEDLAHSSKTNLQYAGLPKSLCIGKQTLISFPPPIFFFFNPRFNSSPHSKGALGNILSGSPVAPNISLHHYANTPLLFPHSGQVAISASQHVPQLLPATATS